MRYLLKISLIILEYFIIFRLTINPCNKIFDIFIYTVKPVLETTCIKQSTALRDHCPDTIALLKLNLVEPACKDHLLQETTFIASLGWSLNTGYTVPLHTKEILEHNMIYHEYEQNRNQFSAGACDIL